MRELVQYVLCYTCACAVPVIYVQTCLKFPITCVVHAVAIAAHLQQKSSENAPFSRIVPQVCYAKNVAHSTFISVRWIQSALADIEYTKEAYDCDGARR